VGVMKISKHEHVFPLKKFFLKSRSNALLFLGLRFSFPRGYKMFLEQKVGRGKEI